jgi:hypothetical protein
MELLFQRPTLVRAFYYFESRNYLCWHSHDDDLLFQRDNVIYLYRDPVDTVYSQLKYTKSDLHDSATIESCALRYRHHLAKWLLYESHSRRKLLIAYQDLEFAPLKALHSLSLFFQLPWDETRAKEVLAYVTREVVSAKTKEHDGQVINLQADYSDTRKLFRQNAADRILRLVLDGEPMLKPFFPDQSA